MPLESIFKGATFDRPWIASYRVTGSLTQMYSDLFACFLHSLKALIKSGEAYESLRKGVTCHVY
jgi:hypothetical protein